MNTESESEPAAEEQAPAPEETGNLEDEVLKLRDTALRAQADLQNYRKRVVREKEDAIRYANAGLLESLLPILDNFELGLDAARTATDPGAIVQGLEMVRKQLTDFLREQGIEVVSGEGGEFDPTVHEAVGHEANPAVPEGGVIRQLRRGYKLRDRLIRPASVVVSKGSE